LRRKAEESRERARQNINRQRAAADQVRTAISARRRR